MPAFGSPHAKSAYRDGVRIWSLHPGQLDRQGLIACWRETLLAQAVLLGRTRGYTRHPQLERFRVLPDPAAAVGRYLTFLADDADRRGYRFDRTRIERSDDGASLEVSTGQLGFEWAHLLAKLEQRSPDVVVEMSRRALVGEAPLPHPMMTVVPGRVADWERP